MKTIVMVLLVAGGCLVLPISRGQTVIGILPVSSNIAGLSDEEVRDWNTVILSVHDYLVNGLSGNSIITSKLTREHLLLLLKEFPSINPENLDKECYKAVCRKEKLNYLLKCAVSGKPGKSDNLAINVNLTIIDGNSGTLFWEKSIDTATGHGDDHFIPGRLFEDVFKPLINNVLHEIKSLNF